MTRWTNLTPLRARTACASTSQTRSESMRVSFILPEFVRYYACAYVQTRMRYTPLYFCHPVVAFICNAEMFMNILMTNKNSNQEFDKESGGTFSPPYTVLKKLIVASCIAIRIFLICSRLNFQAMRMYDHLGHDRLLFFHKTCTHLLYMHSCIL